MTDLPQYLKFKVEQDFPAPAKLRRSAPGKSTAKLFPDLKIKALVNFPGRIIGGAGIEATKQNGSLLIDLNYNDFGLASSVPSADVPNTDVLTYNHVRKDYVRMPISLVGGGGGGISEAPLDGFTYGRVSANWSRALNLAGGTLTGALTGTTATFPGKPNQLGTASGTSSVGAVAQADANIVLYNAGATNWAGIGTDTAGSMWFKTGIAGTPAPAMWIHGTNRTVNFDLSPFAPTPTAGDNSTKLATTAFVQAGAVKIADTRAILAGLATSGLAILSETNRDGLFQWTGGNLSGQVAADKAQGIYVAPTSNPSGSTGAWVRQYSGAPDAKWFGAYGDGASHPLSGLFASLAAAQAQYPHATALSNQTDWAAIVSGLAQSNTLRVAAGTYLVDQEIVLTGNKTLIGDGRFATTLQTTSATATVIRLAGYFATARGFQFTTSVTRTAGWAVVFDTNCAASEFFDFVISAFFEGIYINGISKLNIRDGEIAATPPSGVSIRIDNGLAILLENLVLSCDPAQACFAHIAIQNTGDITMNYVQALSATVNLFIDPSTGQEIDSVQAANCFFDQPGGWALQFSGTGSGRFQRSTFINCWFCAGPSSGAIDLSAGGSNLITGIKFIGCILCPNPSTPGANGFNLSGAGVKNIIFSGGSISGMNVGIALNTFTGRLVVTGSIIGPTDGFGPNTYPAFLLSSTNYNFTGNALSGNTNGVAGHGGNTATENISGNI